MRLTRTAAVATILATAASTLVAGTVVPAANAVTNQQLAPSGADGAEDSRDGNPLVRPTRERLDAVRDLVARAGAGTRVTWDDRLGTPRTIYPRVGQALSGPHDGSAVEAARPSSTRTARPSGSPRPTSPE